MKASIFIVAALGRAGTSILSESMVGTVLAHGIMLGLSAPAANLRRRLGYTCGVTESLIIIEPARAIISAEAMISL